MSGTKNLPPAEDLMSAGGRFLVPQVQSSGAPPLTKSEKIKPCCILPGTRARKTFSRCKFLVVC